MECALCHGQIERYNPAFHHLELDGNKAVDLCQHCIDRFIAWQNHNLAKLFPTKTLKKMYGEEKRR